MADDISDVQRKGQCVCSVVSTGLVVACWTCDWRYFGHPYLPLEVKQFR